MAMDQETVRKRDRERKKRQQESPPRVVNGLALNRYGVMLEQRGGVFWHRYLIDASTEMVALSEARRIAGARGFRRGKGFNIEAIGPVKVSMRWAENWHGRISDAEANIIEDDDDEGENDEGI